MIADMKGNKKLSTIVTELFMRGRNLISLVSISQNFLKISKDIKQNAKHHNIMKTINKGEL